MGWVTRRCSAAEPREVQPLSTQGRLWAARVVPADLDVHLVWDNYATHKAKIIRDWLLKRPRWYVHLTPTSSSWLNQVERFFALLTDKQIRRGVHRSVAELEAAIQSFLEQHNVNAKAFNWIKSADDILAAIERYCVRSNTISRII